MITVVSSTKQQILDKLWKMLSDPSVRTLEATVYYETVDSSSNVHAVTRVLRYDRDQI